jgi:DNA-binding GntR family transcriptional regulator
MTSFPRTSSEPPGGTPLARHRVRDAIQRLILSGEYQPGQRLVQQELAGRFGVAQSVVRESLLELQFCGLVRAVDNLGMFVSGLEGRTLVAAYEIREMFEGLGARLSCHRASRADLAELVELAEENYRLGRRGDLEAMSALDRQFHYRMILASGNELLAKLTESYQVLGMFVRADRDIRQVRDEHREIVAAIEANRPAQAERLARRHVQAARQAIERQVAENTFAPQWVGGAHTQPAGDHHGDPTPPQSEKKRNTGKTDKKGKRNKTP